MFEFPKSKLDTEAKKMIDDWFDELHRRWLKKMESEASILISMGFHPSELVIVVPDDDMLCSYVAVRN